jgi:hypothetical protein
MCTRTSADIADENEDEDGNSVPDQSDSSDDSLDEEDDLEVTKKKVPQYSSDITIAVQTELIKPENAPPTLVSNTDESVHNFRDAFDNYQWRMQMRFPTVRPRLMTHCLEPAVYRLIQDDMEVDHLQTLQDLHGRK